MDIYRWLVEEWENGNLIPQIEDSIRSGEFEVKQTVGFQIGDTVRITAEDFDGQEGELQAVEPLAFVGEFYGVYLESTQNIQWFAADEIEKVR